MKKETLIIIFYVLYFTWLFTVTYLSPDTAYLNIFTLVVIGFYFLFLKEKGDLVWFTATFLGALLGRLSSVDKGRLNFDIDQLRNLPIWLPIAWGTTIVALRKFFVIVNVGKD